MKLAIFSAVSTYLPAIEVIANKTDVELFVGLSPELDRSNVSGYKNYDQYCAARNIPYLEINDYSLRSPEAHQALSAHDFDLVIVLGWQRLIPSWFLRKCNIGCIGVHGSMSGISAGRGRSPLNWAMILRAKTFDVSLFFMTPGVDDGPVISSDTFQISHEDTIATLYGKLAEKVGDLFIHCFDTNKLQRSAAKSQSEVSYYLPSRIPEDGAVDWTRSSEDIVAFIRALTLPYPGAFSPVGEGVITFWEAVEAQCLEEDAEKIPGTILEITNDQKLRVRTGTGAILVSNFEARGMQNLNDLQAGLELSSVDFSSQLKSIADRHYAKYPNQPLSPHITACLSE